VRVDDPRRHERAASVDHRLAVGREFRPDLDDQAVAGPDVGDDRRHAGAVDDRAPADEDVGEGLHRRHRNPGAPAVGSATVVSRTRGRHARIASPG